MNAIKIDIPLRYYCKFTTPKGQNVPVYRYESGDNTPKNLYFGGRSFFPVSAIRPCCRYRYHGDVCDDEWLANILFKTGTYTCQAVTTGTPEGLERPEYFVFTDDVPKIFIHALRYSDPPCEASTVQASLEWWYNEVLPKLNSGAPPDVDETSFTEDDIAAIIVQAKEFMDAGLQNAPAVIAAINIRAKKTGKNFSAFIGFLETILK